MKNNGFLINSTTKRNLELIMLIFTYVASMFPLMEIQVGLTNRNQISICPPGISTSVSAAFYLLSGLGANWPPHFSPHTQGMLLSHSMHGLTSLHMDTLLQAPVPYFTVDPHPTSFALC